MIFSILLSSFTVVSAQETATVQDTLVANDLSFAKALKIIDEKANGDDGVSRGELATILFNIIMPSHNNGNGGTFGEFRFLDVPQDLAPQVSCVSALGIMTGTSETTFVPDRNVTYSELTKVIVSFLGYEEHAKDLGGYPMGYIIMADRLDIDNNNVSGLDAEITFNTVSTMLKKAINVAVNDSIITNGEQVYYGTDNKSYLEYYMGITTTKGVLNADNLVDTTGRTDSPKDWSYVRIGNDLFKIDNEKLVIRDLVGYNVEAYHYIEQDEVPEILYCEAPDTNVSIRIQDKDLVGLRGEKIYYYNESGKEKYYKISLAKTAVIYNDTLCASWDASTINPFNNAVDGWVDLIDNNNDGVFDYVFVNAYESYVVNKVDDGIISLKYRADKFIDINEKVNGEDIDILNILNKPLSVEEINEGDILNVFFERNTSNVKKIVVTIDNLIGVITKTKAMANGLTGYYIGETYFESSVVLSQNPQASMLGVGKMVKVYLNMNMRICDVELKEFDQSRFAYISALRRQNGIDAKYEIKLFTDAGVFEKYELPEKLTLNGVKGKTDAEAVTAIGTELSGEVKRQIVIFKTDADRKKITELILWDGTTDTTQDGFYQYPGYDGVTARTVAYRPSSGSFGSELLLSNATVVFCVPSETQRDDDDLYKLKTRTVIPDGNTSYNIEAYGKTANDPCADALVILGAESFLTSISSTASLFVIENIYEILNEETGDAENVVEGYLGTTKTSYSFEDGKLNVVGGLQAENGDIIRVNVDTNNNILSAECVFDYSAREIAGGSNPSDTSFTAKPRYSYGTVKRYDGTAMTVDINGTTEHFLADNFTWLLCEQDRNGVTFTSASASKLRPEEIYGIESASKVFLYQREAYSIQGIIIND